MKRPKGSICGYSLKAIQKLVANVKLIPDTGCWEWQGAMFRMGYGAMCADGEARYAHRVAYEIFCGEIVGPLVLDHLCGNQRCVNPAHLEPVTRSENGARAVRPGRDFCREGHPLRGANVIIRVDKNGGIARQCRACRCVRKRTAYRRKRLKEGAARSEAVVLLGSIDEGAPEIRIKKTAS